MIFQTFDEKNKCTLIYKKGVFSEEITDSCTKTWSYATYLKDKEIEYANLYTGVNPWTSFAQRVLEGSGPQSKQESKQRSKQQTK